SPQPPFAALNLAVSKRIFALWGKGGLRFAPHWIRGNSSPQSTYSKLQRSLGLSFQPIIAHPTVTRDEDKIRIASQHMSGNWEEIDRKCAPTRTSPKALLTELTKARLIQ